MIALPLPPYATRFMQNGSDPFCMKWVALKLAESSVKICSGSSGTKWRKFEKVGTRLPKVVCWKRRGWLTTWNCRGRRGRSISALGEQESASQETVEVLQFVGMAPEHRSFAFGSRWIIEYTKTYSLTYSLPTQPSHIQQTRPRWRSDVGRGSKRRRRLAMAN